MSCEFAHDDGAYVLGALSSTERLEFERHLADCERCTRAVRELAGIPGLLGRVEASVLEHPPAEESAPPTLLPSLWREVHRVRRRRTFVTSGLAAAAVATAGIVPVVVAQVTDGPGHGTAVSSPSPSGTAPRSMHPVGDVPVQASLALVPVAWGTRLDLSCTYEPDSARYHHAPAMTYGLYVQTHDGRTERVGTWRASAGKTLRLSAATATPDDEIESVQMRTADGRVVLKLGT